MKKTYISPALCEQLVQTEMMIAASIKQVGGDAEISIGEGDAPEEADVKGNFFGESIFE